MAPVRVLQVVPAMNAGGMENFIMNVYRAIDRQRVQFDFLYHFDMPCFFDEEITALGGQITKLTVRQDLNLPRYLHQLNQFFSDHPEYKVVHGHYSGFGMFYNHVARRHGVPVRAGHSHNTSSERSLIGLLDASMSWFFNFELTDRFACGQDAGKALFRGKPFVFLPNGVDAAAFAFDPARRETMRASFGFLPEHRVLGHVGRFNQQKNHGYLLEIFAALAARCPEARLLLVGTGPLEEEVRRKAETLGLTDKVVFAGLRRDTAACYDAMDAFLLPSLFEGLPVTMVEAQAAGLPCYVSDVVDRSAAIADGVQFLPLNNAPAWAEVLEAPLPGRNPRALEQVRAAHYDIVDTARYLQRFYLHAYGEDMP